jgi:DNA-binding CsgD family transcriptional regulator
LLGGVLDCLRKIGAIHPLLLVLEDLHDADHGTLDLLVYLARHLGDAAALARDRTASRAYYLQALEVAGKIRFRPELALTHLRLAELLVEEGGESEALEHLDAAIPELRDMNMQPALERGLSLQERVDPHAAPALSGAASGPVLTGREQEVARLLADGRSNREIADTLVITEGTVEVHVKHILEQARAQVACTGRSMCGGRTDLRRFVVAGPTLASRARRHSGIESSASQ